jgi:hypothetical protein
MIVVVGSPIGRLSDGAISAAGTASLVALSAAGAGRTVQLVGRVGDDPTADGVVLDLARGGVGHVALLRDGTRATPLEPPLPDDTDADGADADGADADGDPLIGAAGADESTSSADGPLLEAADVDLGLRYLTEFAVLVVAEPVDPATVAVVAEAASWGDARLILIVCAGERVPDGLPTDVVIFEAPAGDPEGVFASLVGTFAAGLDDGTAPEAAFRASLESDGWTGAAED